MEYNSLLIESLQYHVNKFCEFANRKPINKDWYQDYKDILNDYEDNGDSN